MPQQSAIESARANFGAGRYADAELACMDLLRRDAADGEALHLLALLRYNAGQRSECARLLELAVAVAPQLAAAHNDLGALLITLGKPEQALKPLHRAIELAPANVEAHLNLGNALHAEGNFEGAEERYRASLALDARSVRAHVSLGNLLYQTGRAHEAVGHLSTAAALEPRYAVAHQSLGNALNAMGRTDEAIASYERALALQPGNADANESLGLMLKSAARLEQALPYFRSAASDFARAQELECLLRLGRADEFFDEISGNAEKEALNLHSASLSAYASHHLGRPDPHPFCPEPMARVKVLERYSGTDEGAAFLRELIAEASGLQALWEPRGVTTKRGFQTGGNVFRHGLPALARFERDVLKALKEYRATLPADAAIARRWPEKLWLKGWFVRLLRGGQQNYHNHPFGWVSGCLYLQIPNTDTHDEGSIEFCLTSGAYPPLSEKTEPTLRHKPHAGQLALFPSSLYHRTVPFDSNEERLCIAFDVYRE